MKRPDDLRECGNCEGQIIPPDGHRFAQSGQPWCPSCAAAAREAMTRLDGSVKRLDDTVRQYVQRAQRFAYAAAALAAIALAEAYWIVR